MLVTSLRELETLTPPVVQEASAESMANTAPVFSSTITDRLQAVTDKIDDGCETFTQIVAFFKEKAEIDKAYAKALKAAIAKVTVARRTVPLTSGCTAAADWHQRTQRQRHAADDRCVHWPARD